MPLFEPQASLRRRPGGTSGGRSVGARSKVPSDAAHELRTPITAVGLYAQLARNAAIDGQQDALLSNLAGIDASCRRASGMLEQLLILARLDPENPPARAPVVLDALVRDAVSGISTIAEANGVDIGLLASESSCVAGDALEFRILIDNLIGNAVRYTPQGGRVDVSLLHHNGLLQLRVDDTGPGLPEAELERVFERFHRLAGQTIPGSGLGLAIVRRISERYGLAVMLKNRREGGLRATVTWPDA